MFELTDYILPIVNSPSTPFICLGVALIAVVVLAATRWRVWGKAVSAAKAALSASADGEAHVKTADKPKVSIVIPACNDAANLETNLPKYLKQNYSGTFEVIVADENSSDDTLLVIQRLKEKYTNLRTTFIPSTARNIAPRKLAVTLGVRAARSEWVVVVNADCEPASPSWLENISNYFTDDTDFVGAYTNCEYDHSSASRRAIFENLQQQAECEAFRCGGSVLGAEHCNVAFRKAWFLTHNGFAESLHIPFGEEAILANAHAEAERAVFPLSSNIKVTQETPSRTYSQTLRVQRAETRRHMLHKSLAYRWHTFLAAAAAQLLLWSTVCYAAIRTLQTTNSGNYATESLYTDAPFIVLLLVAILVPTLLCQKLCKLLDEPTLSGSLFMQALFGPARAFHTRMLRYAHRTEFVRNYLEQTN